MGTPLDEKTEAYSDVLRRPASTEMRRFGDFRKLRSVRIESGKILGEWAATKDDSGYWNPLAAYYKGETPYMALVRTGTGSASVAQFHEAYGPIGEDRSGDSRCGSFDLQEFKVAAWHFRLATALLGSLRRPAALRQKLLEHVDEALGRWHDDVQQRRVAQPGEQLTNPNWRWEKAITNLRDAAGLNPYPGSDDKNATSSKENALLDARARFDSLDDNKLVFSVRRYLSIEFPEELAKVKFRLDFPDNQAPRLIAECHDLLAAFYWMLAKDSDAGRAPLVCASCKKYFFSNHKTAIYCESKECKQRGRIKLNWEQNKEKYNRRRRVKYRRERRVKKRT